MAFDDVELLDGVVKLLVRVDLQVVGAEEAVGALIAIAAVFIDDMLHQLRA